MTKCTVLIDDALSPAELQLLLNAISLFRGVNAVTLENDVGITGESTSHTTRVPLQPSQTNHPEATLDPDTQRYFIDEVIKWAVRNDRLHLEDVRQWSPEEIISQAVAIFESMSEEQKSAVGQNISKYAERVVIKTNR